MREYQRRVDRRRGKKLAWSPPTWKCDQADEQRCDDGLVLSTTAGNRLDQDCLVHQPEAAYLAVRRDAIWCTGVRLYGLRHPGATLLLLAGEHLKVVSERLGHASITLTADSCAHVSRTMQAEAVERLENLLAGAAGAAG